MTLVTRCPTCGTSFRVTEPQLQAQGGKVRCGTCLAVFNGREALMAPQPQAEPQQAAPAEPAAFALEPVAPAQSAASVAGPPESPARAEADEEGPEQLTFDDQFLGEPAARGARGWGYGAAFLALVLAAQAVYYYRGELAARYPALRPHFVEACRHLQCTVSPPQRPRQIAIEASDLQAIDRERPGVIQLTATLRNHAAHDLGYPALDLVLTNTKEHTLARRIFLPREYLDGRADVARGIPASAEITVRLELDTGDLNPAGFRLDLLPAPAPGS